MAYLGENIPKLGFGLMRLPMTDPKTEEIDIEQTKQMADLFLERGFTYFDTAYLYAGGKSELAFNEAVVKRHPRERFTIASKLPAWAGAKTADEAKQMFYTSLERTGAGYFDFYLLHNLGATRTQSFDDFGLWDFVQDLKRQGLIKHVGFSIHDSADVLESVLTAHPEMEFVQLQINYADWESGAVQSRKCYWTARRLGKPIVIMEPVKGGTLANPIDSVRQIFDAANPKASYASWAIRFAASLDGVITVLSGMSTMQQMEDNTSFMRDFKPLSSDEQAAVERAREVLEAVPQIPCTACNYCAAECPNQIVIPKILDALNLITVHNDRGAAEHQYWWETQFGGKASDCIACGACQAVCPQKIEIIDYLKEAVATLEGKE